MQPSRPTCISLRPDRNFDASKLSDKELLAGLEDSIRERLIACRRDLWDVVHFFPVWPAQVDWPRHCKARATEPVFFGRVENMRIPLCDRAAELHGRTVPVTLLGIASTSVVQEIRARFDDPCVDVKTDPQAFIFSESLENRQGIGV